MYLDGGELVVSPTDLTNFLACRHLTRLDLEVATRRRAKPADGADEALALLFAKGMEHERRYLAALRSRHAVTEIDATSLPDAAMATEAAMRAGAPVIYQATFSHAGQRGHADFLLRTSEPSDLGTWSYDVADTKLARRLKVPALLQMAEYGHHLHRLQGRPPRWLTVVAGDGVSHPFRYADVEHYARRVGGRFTDFLAEPAMTTARPVTHCGQCRWQPRCAGEWRRTDHLSLVAGMRGDHREQLEAVGIQTVAALAGKRAEDLPTTIGRTARERLVDQAALQVQERRTGQPVYALLPPVAGLGLLRLPPPSVHDLYLDFEGDPYVEPAGREYLAGLGDRQGGFTAFWAHGAAEERRLTEALVDHLLTAWQADPQLHVYHYAAYEKSALQRLTARHGVREAELDVLLRAEVLVDLYAVVRPGLRISKESYSIKKLESFYWGQVRNEGDVADAMSSVVAYERWLAEGDDAVLEAILAYNRDDVESTRGLHYWLEQRRAELATAHRKDFDRPTPGDATAAEPKEGERAEAERADRLLDAGQPLLAGLVGWHRREARPAWSDVFRLDDLDDDELIDDASALGGVGAPEFVREVNRSRVWRYPFPPQDTKLRIDADALDVDHHHQVGLVVALAADEGWVELCLGRGREPPPVRGLGPAKPILDLVLRSAVAEVAERTLAGLD
nr:TM0106 family RecB-like putative nuclease [Actinomycetota bacterium]